MDKVFFKIIIPNYNNYKYIKKCLDSILHLTFTDWKCIIVDDMSTDKSDEIAEIYARRYPDKFILIRSKEKGHEGGARNTGIDYPLECEYYYFIDGDDWLIDDNVLLKMFNYIKDDKPLVLLFRLIQLQNGVYNHTPYYKFDWNDDNLAMVFSSACIKAVHSSIIEKFLENCDHAADGYWTMKILNHHPTIKLVNEEFYVYNRNTQSVTKNGRYDEDINIFYEKLTELLKDITEPNVKRAIQTRIKKHNLGLIKI